MGEELASLVTQELASLVTHLAGGVVAWAGSFVSRRELWGSDGGNFEEASGWRRTARTEPSFEETIMFATPVSVKAVKVLMRGAKPWGYFGLSTVAAVAAPYSFMLVSGELLSMSSV